MPETYGLPEPEPEPVERVRLVANEAVAGQGVIRTTIVYVLLFAALISPWPLLAVVPAALLMATDGRLL